MTWAVNRGSISTTQKIQMKIKHIAMLFISAVVLSACDASLFTSKDQGLTDLAKIEQRWSDAVELARNTNRGELSGPVQNMQTIKQDLQSVKVSECMTPAKTALSEHMNHEIDLFLQFMGASSTTYNREKSFIELTKYYELRDKCRPDVK
jgi:hypothetical protein